MDDATEELVRLAGLTRPGWLDVEAVLKAQMPADYRELASRFGTGCFNGFMWLYLPGCPNEFLDLDRQATEQIHWLRVSAQQGEEVPPEALVEPPSLRPWAATDNGDTVWWLPGDEADESGQVMVSAARPLEWETFEMSCSRFLERYVGGDLPSDIMLSDMSSRGFTPWQASME